MTDEGHAVEDEGPDLEDRATGDDAIRELVRRLARRHPSGGVVIERAAILAEAGDAMPVLDWIARHGGIAEEAVAASGSSGLHGARQTQSVRAPLRYVIPAEALGA